MRNDLKLAAQRLWHAVLCCMLAGSVLIACGAPAEDFGGTNDGDIGQTEEALKANGPNYGISTPSSHLACNATNTGQSCYVPKSLAQTYCYTGFTASQQQTFDGVIAEVAQANSQHFTFGRALISTADCLAGVAGSGAIKIRPGTGNCSGGATSTSVDAYVCYVPANITAITESVPGQWQRMAGGDVFVDSTDLVTQDGAIDSCVGRHGIRHAMAAVMGLGANNPSCSGSLDPFGSCITGRNINPKVFDPGFPLQPSCVHNQLSNQEKCEANSYVLSPQDTWSFNAASCPL